MASKAELKKRIREILGQEGGRPLNKSEIARTLEVPGNLRSRLRECLREMQESGEISQGKKSRFSLGGEEKKREGLIGKIRLTPAGHGWFMVSQTDEGNIATGIDLKDPDRYYVSARGLSNALDGDIVLAKLVPNRGKQREKDDFRARVIKVVERRSGRVTGVLIKKGKFSSVKTKDERLPPSISVESPGNAKSGQVVAVEITDWEKANDMPKGKIVDVLGWPGDPGVDVVEIIQQHGINQSFPPEVVEAARKIPDRVPQKEIDRREDWRDRPVITIDPLTAKDFDDAIWVGKTEKGWQLAVHIADVSHYVKPGSILDIEARARGNSTYLVDRVIPMLPEELSNGICSLVPQEDRLTKCALMNFDKTGRMTSAKFYDAVIRTPRKFAYEEAQKILERPGSGGALGDEIRGAWELARVLRKRRFENGGLDMEMPEIRIVLNEEGVPTGYQREEYNESHQLIEEFMLAANEAVARKVKNSGKPTIYRVHEDPDADKLHEFAEMARSHGYRPGNLNNRKHIQKLLDDAKGSLEEPAIKLGLLKSLKRACYLATPDGHYGLAKNDYCHFTSPIRRYADLVMHRALQGLLVNSPAKVDRTPKEKECVEIAEHISSTERTSADAETESRRMKMLEWLELSSQEAKPPVFEAIITEVRAMGLFMECTDILQRGLVKREGFPEGGFWSFEPNSERFTNRRGEVLQAGQRIMVVVDEVDQINKRVNFAITKVIGGKSPKKKSSRKVAAKKTAKKTGQKKKTGRPAQKKNSRSAGKRKRR